MYFRKHELALLPEWILVRTLELLDSQSLIACEQTCRTLRKCIVNSSRIQYMKECFASGKTPLDSRTPSHRLLTLLRGENHAWRKLDIQFFRTMRIPIKVRYCMLAADDLYIYHGRADAEGRPTMAVPANNEPVRYLIGKQNLPSSKVEDQILQLSNLPEKQYTWKIDTCHALVLVIQWTNAIAQHPAKELPEEDKYLHTFKLSFLSSTDTEAGHPLAYNRTLLVTMLNPRPSCFMPHVGMSDEHVVLLFSGSRYGLVAIDWRKGIVKVSSSYETLQSSKFEIIDGRFLLVPNKLTPQSYTLDLVAYNDCEESLHCVASLALPKLRRGSSYSPLKVFQFLPRSRRSSLNLYTESFHHRSDTAGVTTLEMWVTSIEPLPRMHLLFLNIRISGLLAFSTRFKETPGADVRLTPWSEWSRGIVHILEPPMGTTAQQIGTFADRLLYQTGSELEQDAPPFFKLYDFSLIRKRRRDCEVSSQPPVPILEEVGDGADENSPPGVDQTLVLSEPDVDTVLGENVVSMPFTLTRAPFPSDYFDSRPAESCLRSPDTLVFNDKFVVLSETYYPLINEDPDYDNPQSQLHIFRVGGLVK